MSDIIIDADTSRAEQKIREAEQLGEDVSRRQIAMLRRGTELGLLTLSAVMGTLDQSTRVYAYIIQTGIETLLTIQSAYASSGIGGALIAFGYGAFQIGLLYAQLHAVQQGNAEFAGQMNASYSLLKQTGAFLGS